MGNHSKKALRVFRIVGTNQRWKKHGVVDKIMDARNKLIAHLDIETMRKEDDFLKANNLNPAEIQIVFNTMADVADQLASRDGISKVRYYFDRIQADVQDECDKWLQSIHN